MANVIDGAGNGGNKNIFDDINKKLKEYAQKSGNTTRNKMSDNSYSKALENKSMASNSYSKATQKNFVNNTASSPMNTGINTQTSKTQNVQKGNLADNVNKVVNDSINSISNEDRQKVYNDRAERKTKFDTFTTLAMALTGKMLDSKYHTSEVVKPINKVITEVDNVVTQGYEDEVTRSFDKQFEDVTNLDAIKAKLEVFPDYRGRLYDENGNLRDYTEEIETLQNKLNGAVDKTEIKTYKKQLEAAQARQNDVERLTAQGGLQYLEENGASQEVLNDYKKAIVRGEFDFAQRLVNNFGGTLEGAVGSFAKGVDTLYWKTQLLLGGDYNYNGSKLAERIIDDSQQLQQITVENAGAFEGLVYQTYDGMAPFLYSLLTANTIAGGVQTLGNYAAAKELVGNALYLSDIQVLGQTMYENEKNGFDKSTAFNNAIQKAAASHITESIGGETIANILTGEVGGQLVANTWDYLTRTGVNAFASEFFEEYAESGLDFLVDATTINKELTVKDFFDELTSEDTLYEALIGGLGGLVMGEVSAIKTTKTYNSMVKSLSDFEINTKKDYNAATEASKMIDNVLEKSKVKIDEKKAKGLDTTIDENQLFELTALNGAFKKKIAEYVEKNPYANAINKEGDNIEVTGDPNYDKSVINDARPTFFNEFKSLTEMKTMLEEQGEKAITLLSEKLQNDGVNISQSELSKLSKDEIDELMVTSAYAKSLNRSNVMFANITDKNGDIIDGVHDDNTNTIVVNPHSKRGALSTLIHEYTHGTEASKYYDYLDILTDEFYGDKLDDAIKQLKDNYASTIKLTDDGAKRELVALTTQNLLGNQDYVDRLVRYNNSLAYQMYEEIKFVNEKTNTAQDIEQNFLRAFKDIKQQTTNDVEYSISEHDTLMSDDVAAMKNGRSFSISKNNNNYINSINNEIELIDNENKSLNEEYDNTNVDDGYRFELEKQIESNNKEMASLTEKKNDAIQKLDKINNFISNIDYDDITTSNKSISTYLSFTPEQYHKLVNYLNSNNIEYEDVYSDYTEQELEKEYKKSFDNINHGIIFRLSDHDSYNSSDSQININNIPNNKTQFSISKNDISNYNQAVQDNDLNTAQQVVDKVAAEKGYTKVYHGTNKEFTTFKLGWNNSIYMATNRDVADAFALERSDEYIGNGVMDLYVKFDNPMIVSGLETYKYQHIDVYKMNYYYNIPTPQEMIDKGFTNKERVSTEEIAQYAQSNGYDGVIINDITEGSGHNTTDYIAFDPSQIKSADPFTYDDQGDIIPLEQRFNEDSNDIRYSVSKDDWLRYQDETSKVIEEANTIDGNDLNDIDISNIINQNGVTKETLDKMEKSKQVMIDNVPKWVKGYDTIKYEYPMFSNDTLNSAIYESLVYGDLTPDTYNKMANTISADFELEGIQGNIHEEINKFIKETLETFSNEAKYKAGETPYRQVKQAINENVAYNQSDVQGSYEKFTNGEKLNHDSEALKQNYQDLFTPIAESLVNENARYKEVKGKPIDSNISDWKTFYQNIIQTLPKGNVQLQQTLRKILQEDCLDSAASREIKIKNEAQDIIKKINDLGIVGKSKESQYLQYYLEQHTEKFRTDLDLKTKIKLPDGTMGIDQAVLEEFKRNPWESYTLDNLKKDMNYKMSNGKYAWENIVEASKILRDSYDDTIDKVNRTQIDANGDVEGKEDAETTELLIKVTEAFDTMQTIKDEIRRNGSKDSTQAAYEIAKKKYNTLMKQYNNRIEKDERGDLTRRNLTPYRNNYSHHILKRSIGDTIKSISNAEFSVPSELAGISDYTKPNTIWSSFSAAQEYGKYTPDAVSSFAAYMDEASRVIAYNPVILELKQFNSTIRNSTKGNSLNRLIEYLDDYCNMLAGKRDSIDRGVQKRIGAKAMKVVSALNGYAKQSALYGNVRTGLVQFANIPNGLGILESKGGKKYVTDVGKGLKAYLNGDASIEKSAFITNRFFDFDTGEHSFTKSLNDKAQFILTKGDEIGSKLIWYSAYEQGKRLGVDNLISYADDITRSAVAGRQKQDLALAMNSQVINLLMPFQVENNNLYQTLKQQAGNKQFGAILTYNITAFIFNMLIKGITGGDDEVLAEFITPIYEEMKKALTEDQEVGTTVKNALLGELGEFISLMPWGSQITSLTFGDNADTLFGDYNPSRYGMTNIGASGGANAATELFTSSADWRNKAYNIVEDLVGGYVKGGKQLTRTIGGLQSMGALPKITPTGETEISPINYNKKGKITYVNDQSDIANWIRASLFGKSTTKQANDYYSNFDGLSKSDTQIFNALTEKGNSAYDTYQDIKTYNDNKDEAKTEKEKGNTEYEETTLRDQLIESGKYGAYKTQVSEAYADYLKSWYKEEHEKDEEPKTFTQFANGYGLTSDDLKKDTYGAFYDKYNVDETTQKTFSKALDIKNSKDVLGKTISNSAAVQRRLIYENAGIYNQILEFIKDNGLEYSDFGLTKSVVEDYDADDMNRVLAKIEGKSYTSSSSSSSGTSSTSKSKQLKAMQQYMKALRTNNNDVFTLIKNATSIEDAKNNVEKIMKKYKG